jgi:hypothetical protein
MDDRYVELDALEETPGHRSLATTTLYVGLAKRAQECARQENAWRARHDASLAAPVGSVDSLASIPESDSEPEIGMTATAPYIAPVDGLDAFNCPHCRVFARQQWGVPNHPYAGPLERLSVAVRTSWKA